MYALQRAEYARFKGMRHYHDRAVRVGKGGSYALLAYEWDDAMMLLEELQPQHPGALEWRVIGHILNNRK